MIGTGLARQPPAWPAIGLPAVAAAVALLVTSGRYGFHRDELYFLEAGRHLAWGYDDQPPLTPLIGRLATLLFGDDSPTGIRVPSALAAAGVILLIGLIARELGGGRTAQLIAAVAAALSPFVLAAGHLLSTTTYDLLIQVAICWLLARLLAGADPRWWLALGVIVGVGLLNKHLVALLVLALAIGIVSTRRLSTLRSKWVIAGVLAAALIALPNIAWQASHDWPQLDLARQIVEEEGPEARVLTIPFLLVVVAPLLLPIPGLVRLARNAAVRPFVPFAIALVAMVTISMATGGKVYYAASITLVAMAAGACAVADWLRHRSPRLQTSLLASAMVLWAIPAVLVALPVLPARAIGDSPIAALNEDSLETIGWPALVDETARVVAGLSPGERKQAVIFTGNYGEAGALRNADPATALPSVFSGHNAFWRWGQPPDSADVVVLVGTRTIGPACADLSLAGRIDNGVDIENEEQGQPIWVCRGLRQPWSTLWPDLHHLS